VHEHIVAAVIRLDEAKTLGLVEPLNRTNRHRIPSPSQAHLSRSTRICAATSTGPNHAPKPRSVSESRRRQTRVLGWFFGCTPFVGIWQMAPDILRLLEPVMNLAPAPRYAPCMHPW
jgi:hypothetical protein